MKFKLITDRGDIIIDNCQNANEARDRTEAEHKGIDIYQYIELDEDGDEPKGKPKARR